MYIRLKLEDGVRAGCRTRSAMMFELVKDDSNSTFGSTP